MGAGPGYVHLANPAETLASGQSPTLRTELWYAARIDITVGAFVGGTTPNLTFFWETRGEDGLWYTQWTSAAVTGAGPISVNLSDRLSETYAAGTVNAQHCVFTLGGRLRWLFGGAVAATSIAFSASVIGRS